MNEITEREFIDLTEFIYKNFGIHIKENKKILLSGRLTSLFIGGSYENYSYLIDKLKKGDTNAISDLIEKITTRHTFFLRENSHFDYLTQTVLPEMEEKLKERDLRIWCSACSTGEEAYTIAILLQEYFGKSKIFWDMKLLATDLSESALKTAVEGIYSEEKVRNLPQTWINKYFEKADNGNFIITDDVKNEIYFRKFNLKKSDFNFKKKLHIIFCRNVMIYFDEKNQKELVEKLYDSLEYGGYLFIGHSESIMRDDSSFKYVMPAVYKKI